MITRSSRSISILAILLLATSAAAQTPVPEPAKPGDRAGGLTLLTQPKIAQVRLDGRARLRGASPLDLPEWLDGRYSVTVEGPGVARTQGILFLPEGAGDRPALGSEPPGLSAGLIVRSLNYPGIPDISARRLPRGLALAAAGTGAGFAGLSAHLRYRDRLKEFGPYAADRARDERHARATWITYGLAAWGLSAVDYWIRPRFEIQDPEPTHATIVAPAVTRTGAAWRSLLVPGAGQEFANHRARGTVWLAAFLGAGGAFAAAEAEVGRNQTRFDWARALVDSAGPTERPARLKDVEVAQNDLESSEDVRRGVRYALIGIYAANFIDALLMPIHGVPTAPPPRVSARFPVGPDGAGVALTLRY